MDSSLIADAGASQNCRITAGVPGRDFDLRALADIWYRRRLLLLTILVMTLIGTEFAIWVVYPAFESRVEILIGAQAGLEIPFSRDVIAFKKSEITETQCRILTNRPNIEHAVRVLRLDQRPKYADGLRGRVHRFADGVVDWTLDRYESIKRWVTETVFGGAYKSPAVPTPFESAVARLEDSSVLKAEPISNTDLIVLTVRDRDPEAAAAIADELSKGYLSMELDLRKERARTVKKAIDERLLEIRPEFQAARDALAQFRETHGIIDVSKEMDAALTTLSMLETTYWDVSQKESARVVSAWDAERRDSAADRDLRLRSKTALIEKLGDLASVEARYRPDHPKVQAARAAVEEIRRQLKDFPATDEAHTPNSAPSAESQPMREPLLDRIQSLRQRLVQLTQLDNDYQALLWEQENSGDVVKFLSRKREDALTAEQTTQPQARIVEPAQATYKPAWPPKWLYRGLALLTSIAVAVGLGALLERLDDTIRSPEAAMRLLGLPTLGSIPGVPR